MDERIAMMRAHESGAVSVSALCELYGISRETFYVCRRRRAAGEARWFEERSRAPGHCPHVTPPDLVAAVVALRQRHPRFGPKKIRARLEAERPGGPWPAVSTIGAVLKRAGLVPARARRRRPLEQGYGVAQAPGPNDEWAIDFKGWFRTADGTRCDPLTLSDTATRYLVEVRITEPTHAGVRGVLERVFAEVGLPGAVRSDNGPPFGSTGAGGLSRLSVWLLKLGIEPRFIPPASPQDNGRHERLHRTLKDETSRPAARTRAEQQARFAGFQRAYNEERPHEALGQATPASRWHRPARTLPRLVAEPWYDADHEVRRVRPTGEIKWRNGSVFIGEALAGEPVGLALHERGGHIVRFLGHDLGLIDPTGRFHRFAPPRWRLRQAAEPVNLTPP
jgi:transposase InsO family protein